MLCEGYAERVGLMCVGNPDGGDALELPWIEPEQTDWAEEVRTDSFVCRITRGKDGEWRLTPLHPISPEEEETVEILKREIIENCEFGNSQTD